MGSIEKYWPGTHSTTDYSLYGRGRLSRRQVHLYSSHGGDSITIITFDIHKLVSFVKVLLVSFISDVR